MNISNEEIEKEFARQVKLCSGIGKLRQVQLLMDFWIIKDPEPIMKSLGLNKRKSNRRKNK